MIKIYDDQVIKINIKLIVLIKTPKKVYIFLN